MARAILRSLTCLVPDSELLARFVRSREEPAFAELVRRHGPIVYRVCRRIVGPDSADDAFQATFLVLATRADRVQKAASVGSWLIGVAGRVARQMRRRELRQDGIHTSKIAVTESCSRREQPTLSDLAVALDDELTRLPDKLRDPLVACLVQHRTHKQAAAELGSSERTLRRRLDEAKRLLRLRLERRGVVPTVAAGVVCGVGSATANVRPGLADLTVNLVFDFLAGGAAVTSVPAVLAKGVTMTGTLWKLTAAMAGVAVAITALGVGLADEKPNAVGRPQAPDATRQERAHEPPRVDDPAAADLTFTYHGPTEVKGANFTVVAPDAVIARAVANEAEYQRKVIAETWLGKELPASEKHTVVEVAIDGTRSGGASTFTFGRKTVSGNAGVGSVKMQLSGSLEEILRVQLPHEVTHCVLASHFGRPLPRWADEGIAPLSEPAAEQARHDELSRNLVNDGRAIRLKRLLPMTEYPQDTVALYAPGHSLVRFLLTRSEAELRGKDDIPVVSKVPHLNRLFQNAGGVTPHRQLLDFLDTGLRDNTPAGWEAAVKKHYGFADVDALEAAWIDWLRTPESVLRSGTAMPAVGQNNDRIPPSKLRK